MIKIKNLNALKKGWKIELHGSPFCKDVDEHNPFRVCTEWGNEFQSIEHPDVIQYVGQLYLDTEIFIIEPLTELELAVLILEGYV